VDTLEAIRKRRSIRRYTDDAIPKAALEAIVDAGRLAATGSNRQPWDFVVVTHRATIEQFKAAGAWIEKAGAVIVVVMDPDATPGKTFRFGIEDYAAAVENMLLAVTALGYAAVWLDGMLRSENRAAKVGALLGVPASREVRVILPIGVPAEQWAQREKKPFSERAWFNAWAGPASPSRTGP